MNTPDGAGEVDSKELIVDSAKPAAAAANGQSTQNAFTDLFVLALKCKAPSKFQAVQYELRMQAMAAGTCGFGN